jgi:DNA-binding NarL/FixJ family response regulator
MKTIRVFLAEDQTLMRQGLKTILETEPDLRVVGEAADGKTAVKLVLQLRPDVILMDVQMPQLNGVEATAAICRSWPEARIIILTTFDRDDYVFQGVRAGAVGYLLKDLPAEKLVETIRRVQAGEVFIQPEIASRTLRVRCIRPATVRCS